MLTIDPDIGRCFPAENGIAAFFVDIAGQTEGGKAVALECRCCDLRGVVRSECFCDTGIRRAFKIVAHGNLIRIRTHEDNAGRRIILAGGFSANLYCSRNTDLQKNRSHPLR